MQKAAHGALWVLFFMAPTVGVYLVAGLESLLLFWAMLGLAWWLCRAWLEQIGGASSARQEAKGE